MNDAVKKIPTTTESRLFWIEITIQVYGTMYEEAYAAGDIPLAAELAQALESSKAIRTWLTTALNGEARQAEMDAALEQARIDATGIKEAM